MEQIAINLTNGVCCALRANDGVHCAYNLLDCPPPIPANGVYVYKAVTAHYHKISSRNIFRGFKEQAIMVISDEKGLRYVLGRTNHDPYGGYGTSKFHVNNYFSTVTAVQMSNREQWIVEIE